jgi:hypothetical protein
MASELPHARVSHSVRRSDRGEISLTASSSSEDGDVFVVRAGPKYELLATNSMSRVIVATPAIANGVIRGLKDVFAIGRTP